ncbi:MAG TPA: M13 family metallopeptidase N-terminal domain-containing protein, partial [Bacteroidota bacterium]|nr:M13 family metallopeptidase N-terminal domain-containing protein [Bacteroidota bacterium]
MNRLAISFFLLVPVIGISNRVSSQVNSPAQAPDPLVTNIDTTVRPQDDFFLYANGRWFKEHPIPLSEASNGLWQLIQDTINAQVREICEGASATHDAPKGSNKQKIGDFFFSGMDSTSLNANGVKDLQSEFERIDAITDLKGLARSAAHIHMIAGSPLFGFGVGQDDRISSKNAIFIFQGGLSLPDRRFYLDTDARAAGTRGKFATHLFRMYRIIGYDTTRARRAASDVLKLETALATSSRRREDTRDPLKNYNKISFKQLLSSSPDLDWTEFMTISGLNNVDTVIVGQPEFLTALNGYL